MLLVLIKYVNSLKITRIQISMSFNLMTVPVMANNEDNSGHHLPFIIHYRIVYVKIFITLSTANW